MYSSIATPQGTSRNLLYSHVAENTAFMGLYATNELKSPLLPIQLRHIEKRRPDKCMLGVIHWRILIQCLVGIRSYLVTAVANLQQQASNACLQREEKSDRPTTL